MDVACDNNRLDRHSVFGYSCSRCLSCCRFKMIQINPYEVLRLAGNCGISTTEFIGRYTSAGGAILQSKPDGTCIFLGDEGCEVHPDRPLVCRLYPLGRHVHFLGVETFSRMEPEEGCQGVFHENGTLEQYLQEQDAAPFMQAADLYLDLLWHLLDELNDAPLDSTEAAALLDTVQVVSGGQAAGYDLSWIDMDRVLAQYCTQSGMAVPVDACEKMKMHIKAVRTWAE